ncbi:hypothetical protein ACA910_000089 [Epithemia clementina (nom. ined.)]
MGNQNSALLVRKRSSQKSRNTNVDKPEQSRRCSANTCASSRSSTSNATIESRSANNSNRPIAAAKPQPQGHALVSSVVAVQPPQTANEKVVTEWMEQFRKHDIDAALAMTMDGFMMNWIDSDMDMLGKDFHESMKIAYASMPDLKFHYSSITSIDEERVLISNLYAYGTHTGAPFSFGPYPPLEAKGAKFQDAPIELTATVKNGTITHSLCDAKGEMVGPPGMYEQLGGILM